MKNEGSKVEQSINVENVNINNNNSPSKSEEGTGSKYVDIFKKVFNFVTNTSAWKIVKFFVVTGIAIIIVLTAIFVYRAINNEELVAALARKMEMKNTLNEEAKLNIREDKVTPTIQKELGILCYTLNADRAFLFELHNGKVNATGLPFRYADMSYEEVNEEKDVERIAMQFQDIPLTLYRYPHYLAEHRYLYGSLKEISIIDNAFANHIYNAGGKYMSMLYLSTKGTPLGFLCVAFHDEPKFTKDEIKNKMEQYGKIMTPLLDLSVQIKENL